MKTNISDYRIDNDKLFGIYRGVVEDRFDPEKLCRCRIRVLGVHDELKEKTETDGVPTEELPWAHPCYGLFQGSVSGNGVWAVPLQGSYVFVFFENGNLMQPRYFLSAPGMPELAPDGSIGFNDPDEEWPDKDWLLEPDTHRYSKRDNLGSTPLLETKLPNIREGNDIALGGTWNEAPPMYNTEYPYNNVIYTFAGHCIEIDDTPGFERMHIYHPSNSYLEIDMEGRMVLRNNLDRWDITMASKMEEVVDNHHRLVRQNRTSKVLISEWEEIMIDHYRVIHANDLQLIEVNREHEVGVNDVEKVGVIKHKEIGVNEYSKIGVNRHKRVGINEYSNIGINRHKTVGINEYSKMGVNRHKTVGVNEYSKTGVNKHTEVGVEELEKIGIKKHTYTGDEYRIESGLNIIIRANDKIIFEADSFEFHGTKTSILTSETEIAGLFKWNGVALGTAADSMNTLKAAALGGNTPVPNVVVAMPAEPAEIPAVEAPTAPSAPGTPASPASPPGAPGAPEAPEYEYSDKPPEPDEC